MRTRGPSTPRSGGMPCPTPRPSRRSRTRRPRPGRDSHMGTALRCRPPRRRWPGDPGRAGSVRRRRRGTSRSMRRAPAPRPSRWPAGVLTRGHWPLPGAGPAGRSSQRRTDGRTGRWTGSRRSAAAAPPRGRRRPPQAGTLPGRCPHRGPPAPAQGRLAAWRVGWPAARSGPSRARGSPSRAVWPQGRRGKREKSGLRFSRNAWLPSCASSVV